MELVAVVRALRVSQLVLHNIRRACIKMYGTAEEQKNKRREEQKNKRTKLEASVVLPDRVSACGLVY